MGEEEPTLLMDDKLYEAARTKGNDDVIPSYLTTNGDWFMGRTREVKSNILHVAAQYGNAKFIKSALAGLPAAHHHHYHLLCQPNSKGETPLHLASRFGDKKTVEALLLAHDHDDDDDQKKMCWIEKDCNGDTPLHKALRYGHQDIAMMLLQKDTKLVSVDNDAGESPAYLAAENYCLAFLHTILDARRYVDQDSVSYSGPLGMTLFHPSRSLTGRVTYDVLNLETLALKMMPFDMIPLLEQVVANVAPWVGTLLTERLPELVNKVDDDGKTPLHYAAELGQNSVVRKLLKVDMSAAFMYDNEGFTPLLRAASNGYDRVVQSILELCPHSIELRHASDKRTVLHLARLSRKTLKMCIKNHPQVAKQLNETDIDGNTPLHCAILESDEKKVLELLETQGIKFGIKNKQDQTPMEICNLMRKGNMKQQTIWLAFEGGEMVKGIMSPKLPILSWLKALLPMFNDLLLLTEADMKKLLDNVAVAAALLVTLTFAATFTIPGGYDQNTGQVLRMKEPAIKVFVVSDVVAMLLGISVLLKYTFGVIKHASWGPLTAACVVMLQYALQATIIAFISGVYAIVSHDAKWIGVLAIVLGVSLNIILTFIW